MLNCKDDVSDDAILEIMWKIISNLPEQVRTI
jgi:hypothetical protein